MSSNDRVGNFKKLQGPHDTGVTRKWLFDAFSFTRPRHGGLSSGSVGHGAVAGAYTIYSMATWEVCGAFFDWPPKSTNCTPLRHQLHPG